MGIAIHGVTQGHLLERLATEHPAAPALIHPGRQVRWSWSELRREANRWAAALRARGIRKGERVTVWAENRPEWVALQFGLARIGAILVTANTALVRDEIAYLLRQSGSSAIVFARGARAHEYEEALSLVLPDLDHVRFAVALDPPTRPGFVARDEFLSAGRGVTPETLAELLAATAPDDPANIQYTSGTTGSPKGAVLSHRNIVDNACTVSTCIGLGEDDRLLVQVPLFHCFGCAVSVLGAATHRATLVMLDHFEPAAALEAIETEGCTILHGVPAMFRALLDHPDLARRRITTLRGGIMGGAVCPEELMRRVVDDLNCPGMLAAYGLTEASPGVTISSPDDSISVRCTTVGHELPGVEIRIVDPATGAVQGDDERGELQLRGPNVMLGYFEDPEATAAAIDPEGWLRTGDLALRSPRGWFQIVGRIKELILRGGENVYPAEVEAVLRQHPAIRDAAVFGVPSQRYGEEVAAALVLQPGSTLAPDELDAFLADRLAHFKHPDTIHEVDAFPLTASGKIQRYRLRDDFTRRAATEP